MPRGASRAIAVLIVLNASCGGVLSGGDHEGAERTRASASVFDKHGNNGTVSCSQFCQNTLMDWGPLGSCCGATVGGVEVGCEHVPGLLSAGAELLCRCVADAFVKPGNNGTVSCDQFCQNTLAYWGEAGTCLGAKISASGQAVSCQHTPGLLAAGELTCTCRRPGSEGACAAPSDKSKEPAASSVTRIYLSPKGNDANSGLRPDQPVAHMDRVKALVLERLPHGDVEVRIAAGVYHGETLTFDETDADTLTLGHGLTLLPWTYTFSGVPSRPVFDGRRSGDAGDASYFLKVHAPRGRDTNIRVYYLQIQRYAVGGISLAGRAPGSDSWSGSPNATNWNGGNTVRGCLFLELGSRWASAPGKVGLAGVSLRNSRGNTVVDCEFKHLENNKTTAKQIHALYIAHHASDNKVKRNSFEWITGDPIRLRNYSNDNYIVENRGDGRRFYHTGFGAFYSDWYGAGECPSWRNRFKGNNTVSLYDGSTGPEWELKQGKAVPTGCTDEKAPRVCTETTLCN